MLTGLKRLTSTVRPVPQIQESQTSKFALNVDDKGILLKKQLDDLLTLSCVILGNSKPGFLGGGVLHQSSTILRAASLATAFVKF